MRSGNPKCLSHYKREHAIPVPFLQENAAQQTMNELQRYATRAVYDVSMDVNRCFIMHSNKLRVFIVLLDFVR